jgi:hypothetical protein
VSPSVQLEAGKLKVLTAGEQTFSPSESASVRESLKEGENARCRVITDNPEYFQLHTKMFATLR